MTELDDHELLAQYAGAGSEAAFATLVARYVNLVYSAALRSTANRHQAEEITQAVFIILARKAGGLRRAVVLSGWLYQTARLTAANFMRAEARRQRREQEACMQSTLSEAGPAAWEQIAPLLDEAMGCLGETERNAVVLRFFENKSGHEVAAALKLNEAAVYKRVSRALEKLRGYFVKRGVRVSVAVIAGAVAANSVQAAPVGLAAAAAAAAAKGAAVSGSTLAVIEATLKLIAWAKLKIAMAVGLAAILTVGTTTVAVKKLNDRTRPIQAMPTGWSVLNGDHAQWSWSGGQIHGHTTRGDSILASGQSYGNVTLSAVVATTNREASIAIRLRDENNGYIVTFVPPGTSWPWNQGGYLCLAKREDGNGTLLAEHRRLRMTRIGTSAKLKVIARGPTIEVRLDGAKVLQARDTTFSSGRIGFRIYGWGDYPCDAAFSEVRFY